jgi:transposase
MKKMMDKEVKNLTKKLEDIVAKEGLSKSQKMKDMFDLGAEIKDIATRLNVRYNFVYNVISNYCIVNGLETSTEKKESKKDKVWELFDQGKTVKEVAVELKTNYQYVYKLHKEWKELAVKAAEQADKAPETEQNPKLEATGTEGGTK